MITILNISDTKFSYNGIAYFKNFTPFVTGNKVSIVNTYDACISLTNFPTIYSDISVDGVTYGSVSALQNALLPVLFNRTFTQAGSLTAGYIPKATGATTLGNSLIFDNGTNVGIGTTSPSQKLTIGDGTGTGNQYLRVNSSVTDIYIGQSGSGLFGLSANSAGNIASDTASYPLALGTLQGQPLVFGTSNAERMRITSGGNVGIGTTEPTSASGYIIQTINGTSGSFTEWQENGSKTFRVGSDTGEGGFLYTLGAFGIRFGTNGSERMRITSDGNVGIGTTSPKSKLHVVGLPEYTTNAAAISGGLTAGAFYHTAGVLKVVI